MRTVTIVAIACAFLTCVTACVTPAPGADKVRINQAIGLGGNTAFETAAPLGVPVEGIAYRCP